LAGEQWLVPHAATHDHYLLSDDPALIDVVVWHAYLQRSYWAAGMPLELLRKACANSLCVGVYDVAGGAGVARAPMVGAGRIVTDRSTYAYLSDVFVLEEHRGRGLSKAMMEVIMSHPDLQGLRRFALFTKDAHELYRKYGFAACERADRYMERKWTLYPPPTGG